MVEVPNARFAELIAAEVTLKAVTRAVKETPGYRLDDVLNALLGVKESEVKTDAE